VQDLKAEHRMSDLTVALNYEPTKTCGDLLEVLSASPAVTAIIVTGPLAGDHFLPESNRKIRRVDADLLSGKGMASVLDATETPYLLLVLAASRIRLSGTAERCDGLDRMLRVASESGAGLIFSDYFDESDTGSRYHSLIDYQMGSIRDGFDFGATALISRRSCAEAIERHGPIAPELRWAAFYDLRLKLSTVSEIVRIPEPLYTVLREDGQKTGERQFDYVDPKQRDYQVEMESVVTGHLKSIGAFLPAEFVALPETTSTFPVEASVIIPVRNRERTIRDAIASALSQQAAFTFNVIVVDNHSTDGTSKIIRQIAAQQSRLIHIIPAGTDLGIGGCWNEAIYSAHCGRIAAQLDSDDLYKDGWTLEKIVSKFGEGPYAMVIGSYKITNFELEEVPPGLIDHREWTRENGHNNALRINGLGAPRAFYVPVLRKFGLPNTSYGEDYAVALRISREYEIGRIYEPLYFARRWEGNSDAKLDLDTANRYDTYKDRLRTFEIMARRRKNRK
jgi:hypothetical protein